MTWLSILADCQFYGLRPWGYHLTSLLLHAANTVLLFLALRRMTGAAWRSAFVAALFGLHPLHVESVAWVSERKDVLSGFFWMLTLLMYARYAQSPKSQVQQQPQSTRSTRNPQRLPTESKVALSSGAGVLRLRADEQADGGDVALDLAVAGLVAIAAVLNYPRSDHRTHRRSCR